MFLHHFDTLMLKMILKKQKNIILICFKIKNTFKKITITLPNTFISINIQVNWIIPSII